MGKDFWGEERGGKWWRENDWCGVGGDTFVWDL